MDPITFAGVAHALSLALRPLQTSELAPGVPDPPMTDRVGPVFVRGIIHYLAKPKIVLFYVALVPQLVDPILGRHPLQLFVLGTFDSRVGTIAAAVALR